MTMNEIYEAAIVGLELQKREIEAKAAEIRTAIERYDGKAGAEGWSRYDPNTDRLEPGFAPQIDPAITATAKRPVGRPRKNPGIVTTQGRTLKSHNGHHNISAEGKARIIAATKKRWAAWRKAKKAGVK